jgi:phage tail sheath protein FI
MTYGRPGVYISETLLPAPVASFGSANAAGVALGAFAQGPTALTLVTSWYDFVRKFGGFNANFPATFGINQYFVNGGSELYIKRVVGASSSAATASLPSTTTDVNVGTVTAINNGEAGNNLRVRVSQNGNSGTYSLSVYQEVVAEELLSNNNNASNDVLVELFENLVFDNTTSVNFVETVVNSLSTYVNVSISDTVYTVDTQLITSVIPLTGGNDGITIASTDYTDLLPTDGTSELDTIDRPLVIFAPELHAKFVADGVTESSSPTLAEEFAAVHDAILGWADAGNGFAILDTAPSITVGASIDYATARAPLTSQGAIYYPNYYINDPLNTSRGILRKIGPAGAMAGIYMATDKAVGPFKSPAGTGALVRGAISLERAFTSADLDSLNTGVYNDNGTLVYGTAVNAIRNVPGAGIVVMGGRTLKQDGTANKYVNMRRSLIYIKKHLKDLTTFAIFQNNDHKLWAQLTTVITVFLNEYRNQGGLRGANPEQSFYVKIDTQNNTPASIANGEVHIEVGVALEYPAEFVVINLSQITGQ